MRKFVLSVLVSIIMAIGLVSARPLVIDAAALSIYFNTDALRTEWNGKILGDYWQYTTTENATDNDLYIYKFRFDKAYIGQIQFQVRFSGQSSWASGSERVLVAGYESFDWYYREYTIDNQNTRINAVNITSVNLTPLDDFGGDLASIISYLQSIDATEDDIYTVLQSISSDTDVLSKIRQYDIFYESYAVLFDMLKKYEPISIDTPGYYSYTNYPLFNINADDQIYKLYCNNGLIYSFVFYSSTPINSSNISNLHIVKQGGSDSYTLVRRITIVEGNLNTYRIDFSVPSTGNYVISFGFDINYFSPIYCYRRDYEYLSTDFCLLYGFSNQLLNDIHIVAQGTNSSNSSSSNLEDSANEYGELADDVLGLEDDLGSGFSSSLNNVPTTFNFSTQFGNKFLHSATWVRNQFETLTTNTPFGALITFSLVLGLALLLVGRRLL